MHADDLQDLKWIEKLVWCSNNLDINQVDATGNTILYNAISKGNLHVAQMALHHPNIQMNKQAIDGATPLYIASQGGHIEIVRMLIIISGIN